MQPGVSPSNAGNGCAHALFGLTALTNLKEWMATMNKRAIVKAFVEWTDSSNKEIHSAIEEKVFAEYRQLFDPGHPDSGRTIKEMRTFFTHAWHPPRTC